MFKDNIVGIILAGGKKSGLKYLTSDVRAQSAIPFGGKFRIIDFVMSSFFNSYIKKLYVLVQDKSISLSEHLQANWGPRFGFGDEFFRVIGPVPPNWQKGSADSVWQMSDNLRVDKPDYIAVFGGEQISSIDVRKMLEFHKQQNADLTISSLKYSIQEASGRFGIIKSDDNGVITSFSEKTETPAPIEKDSEFTKISLGNYIFKTDVLLKVLEEDSKMSDEESAHDFGRNIIPKMFESKEYKICEYDIENCDNSYWYPMGNYDDYLKSSVEFLDSESKLGSYEPNWPIYSTNTDNLPPARIVETSSVKNSIISDGCVINAKKIDTAILFPNVRVGERTVLNKTILFNDVQVGEDCTLENVIADKRCVFPSGITIKNGKMTKNKKFDPKDQEAYERLESKLHFTESNIAVVSCYHDYSDRV